MQVLDDLHADSPGPLQVFEFDVDTSTWVTNQVLGGGAIRGDKRCQAIGLLQGDCHQCRLADGAYCYYHDKLQSGLISFIMDERVELVIREIPVMKLRHGMRLMQDVRDNHGQLVVERNTLLTAELLRKVRAFIESDYVTVEFAQKAWVEIHPGSRYPVWPLPKDGYQVEAAA